MAKGRRKSEAGLALRMRRGTRVISAQHRQLDDFYGWLAGALERRDGNESRVAFGRFIDALEAHFSLEGGLYFPALRGLAPALARDLAALSDEHQALRERFAALGRKLAGGALDECVQPLESIVGDLAEHEGREEGLLASLHRERNP